MPLSPHLKPYEYKTLNDVPVKWRTYKSAKLNVQQVNEIMADAYTSMKDGIPDYGGSRRRFAEAREIQDGFWVVKRSSLEHKKEASL